MNTYRGSATMAQLMMSELQWPDEVRHLICTPLSHAGSSLFVPLQLQGAAMFVLPTFDAGAVLEAIERHRITTTMLVPSMIYALLDHPRFDETDLSSLQTVFYGASAMSPARLQEAIRKLGPIFVQFYGQTEAPMTVCVLRKEEHDVDDLATARVLRPPGSVGPRRAARRRRQRGSRGRTGRAVRARPARDEGLLEQAGGDRGGVRARLAAHRRRRAARTSDGFLTIVDRKKDMIVSGGFNVFPREVEDVISTHPSVAAVAVIGVPDEKWGEAVKAVVVPRAGQTDRREELIALVKRAQGLAPRAQVDRHRRLDPGERGRQARQEGASSPLLGRRGPPRPLTPDTKAQRTEEGPSALTAGSPRTARATSHRTTRARRPSRRAADWSVAGYAIARRPARRPTGPRSHARGSGGPPRGA